MSNWDRNDQGAQSPQSNVTAFRARTQKQSTSAAKPARSNAKKINADQVVIPYLSFSPDDPVIANLDAIRANNGAAIHIIRHLLPDDTTAINRIATVEREDGSVGFIELRLSTREGRKSYRTLFRADVMKSDNKAHDGTAILSTSFAALARYGLYTPTNVRGLLAAQEYVQENPQFKLAIFWCEGEKARVAVDARLQQETAQLWLAAQHYHAVTSATLGGAAGAKLTNYELRPKTGTDIQFIVREKNATRLKLRDAVHYIVLDNDSAGRAEGTELVDRLEKEYGVSLSNIYIVEPPPNADEGWDDADELPEFVTEDDRLEQFKNATQINDPWAKVLAAGVWPDVDKQGAPTATMYNTKYALHLLGHEFSYDAFAGKVYFGAEECDNKIYIQFRDEIRGQFGFDPGSDCTFDAIHALAYANQYHAVVRLLDNLPEWDGVERLDTWLTTYVGAVDSELNRAIAKIILVAAVRRVRSPGCKFDTAVILEGEQGGGKSAALEILAYTYYSDAGIIHLSEKEQMEKLQGVWIYEMAELDGLNRAETGKAKAFLSRKHDRGRPAYGRSVEQRPRQCVFFGTTNHKDYLRDETGNRRFWPVRVTGTVALEKLAADRDQLWAEANYYEAQGFSIVLPEYLWSVAGKEQEERVLHDDWIDDLREKLNESIFRTSPTQTDYYFVTTTDLYSEHVLDIKPRDKTPFNGKRIASAMMRLGWEGPKDTWLAGANCRAYKIKKSDWLARNREPGAAPVIQPVPVRHDDDDIPF